MMNAQNLIRIIKNNDILLNFCENINNLNILIKHISLEELKRLSNVYPHLGLNQKFNNNSKKSSIFCITLIKNDIKTGNYLQLKKIKFYFNELNGEIIKILQN